MLNQPDEIMAAFRGTALDGMDVDPVPDCDVLAVQWPDPSDVLTGWRAARDVMAVTGRRPVAVSDNYELGFPEVEPAALARIETAAFSLDPWPGMYGRESDEPVETVNLETVSQLLGFWRTGPEWNPDALARELLPGIPASITWNGLNRHLLDQIWDDPARLAQLSHPGGKETSGALNWYIPDHVYLALLPTTSAWSPMTWLDYFGEDNHQVLAACLQQWHQAWGAELVASWGTMLQFVSTRRPRFGPEAWNLARQQLALGGSLQIPQISLAWDLAHTNAWFLHDRP
ncbi:DUF4253 domain-containing protein [Kineosporia sp. NBRC 101731]|uniref:DUF4253 domain-containing protein n=1 Tax=Kineosporia sp. NBRC 101731 TaxID=3032199 RepID=UPI0024A2361D|nr:DUF4253 domain-containing protein [Kineosporia sp. NBRC 101731]GLY27909.1 hypothetical protein Kisp02_12740 [Kineosporia sp. NBRC 101731]